MEVHGMAWAPWKAPFCGVPAGVQQDTSGVSLAAVITPPWLPLFAPKPRASIALPCGRPALLAVAVHIVATNAAKVHTLCEIGLTLQNGTLKFELEASCPNKSDMKLPFVHALLAMPDLHKNLVQLSRFD